MHSDTDGAPRVDPSRATAAELDPQAFAAIVTARRNLARAEQALRIAVQNARRRGMTWEGVGEALGVSRQAAHSKYR